MREFAKAFIVCFMAMHVTMACAVLEYKNAYISGGQLTITQDVIFDANSVVDETLLNITRSIHITNHGNINARMNTCSACNVFVRNTGNFDIEYNTPAHGRLFQLITTPDDIRPIYLNGGFNIIATGQNILSLSELINVSRFADSLILNNTILKIDSNAAILMQTNNVQIRLIGDIHIKLSSANVIKHGPILHNISGDGTVTVFAPDIDKLHAIQSYIIDGDVYGRLVRETDYYKILKNDIGKFLNTLRITMPDDKLLAALDGAETMSDINSIMRRSVRLRPINLMRPLRIMRKYDALDFQNKIKSDMFASADVLTSEYFDMYGINTGLNVAATHNLSIGVSANMANGRVSDDINEYAMITYGGRVNINYDNGHVVAGGDVGANVANFDVGPTLVGNDPRGLMIYGGAYGGYRFHIARPITFMPFVELNGNSSRVANMHNFNSALNTGFEINIHDDCVGIGYDYGIRAMAANDGALGMAARLRIDMPMDYSVVDIAAGVMHDDYVTSFRGTLSVRMMF